MVKTFCCNKANDIFLAAWQQLVSVWAKIFSEFRLPKHIPLSLKTKVSNCNSPPILMGTLKGKKSHIFYSQNESFLMVFITHYSFFNSVSHDSFFSFNRWFDANCCVLDTAGSSILLFLSCTLVHMHRMSQLLFWKWQCLLDQLCLCLLIQFNLWSFVPLFSLLW